MTDSDKSIDLKIESEDSKISEAGGVGLVEKPKKLSLKQEVLEWEGSSSEEESQRVLSAKLAMLDNKQSRKLQLELKDTQKAVQKIKPLVKQPLILKEELTLQDTEKTFLGYSKYLENCSLIEGVESILGEDLVTCKDNLEILLLKSGDQQAYSEFKQKETKRPQKLPQVTITDPGENLSEHSKVQSEPSKAQTFSKSLNQISLNPVPEFQRKLAFDEKQRLISRMHLYRQETTMKDLKTFFKRWKKKTERYLNKTHLRKALDRTKPNNQRPISLVKHDLSEKVKVDHIKNKQMYYINQDEEPQLEYTLPDALSKYISSCNNVYRVKK